jgi:hypothetical protein
VKQQNGAISGSSHDLMVAPSDSAAEREADHNARHPANPATGRTAQPISAARQPNPGVQGAPPATETQKTDAGNDTTEQKAGLSGPQMPTCQGQPVTQWITDPVTRRPTLFGLTVMNGAVVEPEFKVGPAPGAQGVVVLPTSASLPPIQMQFLAPGIYLDVDRINFRPTDDPGHNKPGGYRNAWEINDAGSATLAAGEQEHCTDTQFAFYFSLFRFAEVVNAMAKQSKVYPNERAARADLNTQVRIDPANLRGYFNCLSDSMSKARDPRSHTPRAGVSSVTYVSKFSEELAIHKLTPAALPDVGKHSSGELVMQAAASPRCLGLTMMAPSAAGPGATPPTSGRAAPRRSTTNDAPARLQRKAAGSLDNGEAPPIVHDVLRRQGQPLDRRTRAVMEPHFGHDFSRVRIHTDAEAAASATQVNALAYAVGQHVVFGANQYAPDTSAGKKTLAHELAHVVQQHHAPGPATSHLAIGTERNQFEQEADTAAAAISAARPWQNPSLSSSGPTIRRLGGGSKFLRFFGIEAGEFSEDDLKGYLQSIAKNRQIGGGYLDDDMARALIQRGGVGDYRLDQDFGQVSSIEIRRILIQELLDGPTGDLDERAIIKLLNDSKPSDILAILDPIKGLSVANLESDIDGDNLKELHRVLTAKLPDVGKPEVERNEAPGSKSGACTTTRAIKVHFAHSRAQALINNAIALLDKFDQKPADYKQVGDAVQCQFKGAGKTDIGLIGTNLRNMLGVLPSIRYICPAEPFEQYKVSSAEGVTVLEDEPGLLAIALIESQAKPAKEKSEGAAKADQAEPSAPLKVALFPGYFDLTPEQQASAFVHESFHHAKHAKGPKERYGPDCGDLDKSMALENADSFAAFVMALRDDRLSFDITDCPQAWKDEIVAASRTAQLWLNDATGRLSALLADPNSTDQRAKAQLKRHFKIEASDSAKLKRVRDVFAEIQSAFAGKLPLECETSCDSEDTAGYVGGFLGISPRGGNIHLCPHWFEHLDPPEKAETIVHEMAHRFGGRGEQKYYKAQLGEYLRMTFDDALDNADCFAQFARYLQEPT